jgi:two-component system, cell cycle sensor histidine kinase and response regulator CckA
MEDKRTILVVEDDESIRRQLDALLSEHFDVLLAVDGLQAIACYEKNAERIAAVVTDCDMPRMDGVELTIWLRQRDTDLPVIMTTASLKGKNFGPLLHLQRFILLWKPFDVVQLIDLITTYTAEPSHAAAVK